MLNLEFSIDKKKPIKVLCLGSHSDDIEIGCGGTILRLLSEYEDVHVYWVVFGASGLRDNEALVSSNKFLKNAKKKKVIIEKFRDGFFPYAGGEIKDTFEALKSRFSPDIIFTHYGNDLHQDHRIISELTWNTYRSHFILEYEIMKYDGDLGSPNLFVNLNEKIGTAKVEYLMESFKTQTEKDWFTPDAFYSLLRIRGIESRAPGKYAEAFYSRKIVL